MLHIFLLCLADSKTHTETLACTLGGSLARPGPGLDCVGLLRTGAAEDFTVAGIARKLAEARAEAVFAGHDEAAGAAGQTLALTALQQPARHEVLLKCVLLINGVEAVNNNVLA